MKFQEIPVSKAMEIQELYFESWRNNTENNLDHNVYQKLAAYLPYAPRQNSIIIEFGSGIGASTLEIVKRGYKVIVLEINPYCAQACFEYLKSHSIAVMKSSLKAVHNDIKKSKSSVFIIEGDGIRFLEQPFKADGIVCWLLGASQYHLSKFINCNIHDNSVLTPAKYRKKIHKKIYSLFMNNYKSKTAFIHFCDRGILPKKIDRKSAVERWLADHQEISSKIFSLNGNIVAVDKQILSGIEYQALLNKKDIIDSTPILLSMEAKIK